MNKVLALLAILLSAFACQEAAIPGMALPEAASQPPEEFAYRFLADDIGLSAHGMYRFVEPDFALRTIRFSQRPPSSLAGERFAQLVGKTVTLPYQPVDGFWVDRHTLVLLGVHSLAGTVVVERISILDAASSSSHKNKESRWLIDGLAMAETLFRYQPEPGVQVNSIAEDPTDATRVFLGTYNSGQVLCADLRSGEVECVASSRSGKGFVVPSLGGRGWNGIHAETEGAKGLSLTLVRHDRCSIYDLVKLSDEDGDGVLDRVSGN